MNLEPLQCLGRFPAIFIFKAHSSIMMKPIFWNIRKKLKRFLYIGIGCTNVAAMWIVSGGGWTRGHLSDAPWCTSRTGQMDLVIKGAVEVAYWKVVILHSRGNNISSIIFLNVSEVPNGTKAGSKGSVYFVWLSRCLSRCPTVKVILHQKMLVLCGY